MMCRIVNDCNDLCSFGNWGQSHPHGVKTTRFPELCSFGPVCARLCSKTVPTGSFFYRRPSANDATKKEMSNG